MNSRYGIIIISLLIVAGVYGSAFAGWTPEVRISEPGGCWYPQIAVQGDTIHVVYTNTYSDDKISYIRSIDAGDTWSEHVVLSDTIDTDDAYFPRVILYNSNLIVLWKNTFSEGIRDRNIGYSISHNGGLTWDGPDYLFYPNWEHILYFAASGSNSVINIIFNSRIEQDLRYYNVRSTNFGQSWSDTLELFRSAESGLMDMTAYNNTFHYVWYGNFIDGNIWETYYIRSLNGGSDWSDNIPLVDVDDYGSIWPSLSINESGDIIFCWTDFKYTPNWWTADLFVKYSYDHGESWSEEEQITFSHEDGCSDVFWHNDTINVVWERGNVTHRNIYYRCSTDNGTTWAEEYCLEDDPDDSYLPVVAASNGKVYVVWADDRDDPDTTIGGGIYFCRYEEDVGIDNGISIPTRLKVLSAYPNPFNSSTIISCSNLKGGDIEIYDITGKLVKQLHGGDRLEGKVTWDATDATGKTVCSGIYFARARTPQGLQTLKLIYLK